VLDVEVRTDQRSHLDTIARDDDAYVTTTDEDRRKDMRPESLSSRSVQCAPHPAT